MNELIEMLYGSELTNKIWFHFCNYMKRWYYKKEKHFLSKGWSDREYKAFDSSKMLGYSAMQKVERYEKKYGGIKIVYVDDNVFAGSMLVLIPHDKMGITVIFIPQCTDEKDIFFLYPNHIKQLNKTIDEIKIEYSLKDW
jgi:hypothetical protein